MKQPTDKPTTLEVPQLQLISKATTPGRPRKRSQPPIPQELLDGMSELERDWYFYFIETLKKEYPDLTPFDLIQVYMLLAPCFIACMRLETQQMSKRELVVMSRQDPRSQFNVFMNSLSVRRRDRKNEAKEERNEVKEFLLGLG